MGTETFEASGVAKLARLLLRPFLSVAAFLCPHPTAVEPLNGFPLKLVFLPLTAEAKQ
jgi:hypothetical protein